MATNAASGAPRQLASAARAKSYRAVSKIVEAVLEQKELMIDRNILYRPQVYGIASGEPLQLTQIALPEYP